MKHLCHFQITVKSQFTLRYTAFTMLYWIITSTQVTQHLRPTKMTMIILYQITMQIDHLKQLTISKRTFEDMIR